MKNDIQHIRTTIQGRFEVFLKLENTFHRYFEHKIEKKKLNFSPSLQISMLFTAKMGSQTFRQGRWQPEMACAHPRGTVKNLRYPMVPKIFCRHFGSCITTYQSPQRIGEAPISTEHVKSDRVPHFCCFYKQNPLVWY